MRYNNKEEDNILKRKWIALLLFTLILTPLRGQAQEDKEDKRPLYIERIAGSNRYKTAAKLSKTWESSPYVVVASGETFPDALVGGTLAAQREVNAPVLLVTKNKVPHETTKEIRRLGVQQIYLMGGQNTISQEVENELKSLAPVQRISGKDRYETAEETKRVRAAIFVDQGGHPSDHRLIYANGTTFAEALAAAPWVAQKHGITTQGEQQFYLMLARPGQDVYGYRSVGPQSSVINAGGNIVYGENDYDTAVNIARLYDSELGKEVDTVILVDDSDYPDALAAGPYVAKQNAALLLTGKNKLPICVAAFIRDKNIKKIVIIGGENSVSSAVVEQLQAL